MAGEIMASNRGSGPGFDWLRLILSLGVITLHSFHTAYGMTGNLATNWSSPIWAAILPAFFGLSGFLVTGSAVRTRNVRVFLWFRVLRIVPALTVEVTLSALVLGPIVTSLPFADYILNRYTLSYFGNIAGMVHFYLPGVFLANPHPGVVNRNLGTLHPELLCYIMMAGLMVTGLAYNRMLATLCWVAATIGLLFMHYGMRLYDLQGTFPHPVLVYSFLCGVVLFHWREHIPVSRSLLLAASVVAYILLRIPTLNYVALPFVYYAMVAFGMFRFPRIEFLQRGDYSYGLYLYGYPIQQSIVYFLPDARQWYFVLLLTVPLTLGVAMLSWRFIEKPALKLKSVVKDRPPPIRSTTEPSARMDPLASS